MWQRVIGRQRQVAGVLFLSLLVAVAVVTVASRDDDGERIGTDAGIVARAGLTAVAEPLPVVAGPTTTTSSILVTGSTTTTLRQRVAVDAPTTTTTIRQVALTTSSTAPAPVVAAGVATTSTAAPATSSTVPATTTTIVDPCRNSTDARCGPFRFDPQPGADRPMTVGVTVEPASPVAGQPMVFHITLSDADGVSYNGTTFNFGNSGIGGSTPEPCAKSGPWDPPARDAASATKALDVTHTYFEAGSYTATFFFDAGPFDCVDSFTGRGDRPYASSATGTVTVVVGPAT